jgi:hypothetical protein
MLDQVRQYLINDTDVLMRLLEELPELVSVYLGNWLIHECGEACDEVDEIACQVRMAFKGLKCEFEAALLVYNPCMCLLEGGLVAAEFCVHGIEHVH